MESISPGYYAAGHSGNLEFTVIGSYFDLLPDDVVITTSSNNERPAEHRYSEGNIYVGSLVSKTPTTMVFRTYLTGSYAAAQYVGLLLSNDRSIVYWTNETEPLP